MPNITTYAIDSATALQFRRLAGGAVRDVAGTTFDVTAADNGGVIRCTSASAVTGTILASLGANFYCTIIQWGGGQVTINPDSGVTRNSQSAQYKTAAQYAAVDLFAVAADTFWMGGATAA
jgi:hypothetical protein